MKCHSPRTAFSLRELFFLKLGWSLEGNKVHMLGYTSEQLEWRHLFYGGTPKSPKNKKNVLRIFPLVRNFPLRVATNFLEPSFGTGEAILGERPNTVSESTVSNTELSEFFALTEFGGESSLSSSQPMILCAKANSPSFSQNSPSLPPNSVSSLLQRAANGGLDPSWLDLAFLGRPDFPARGPQIPIFKGFWDLWPENRGAPKTPISTTTDSTPHLRPSDSSETVLSKQCSARFLFRFFLKEMFAGDRLICCRDFWVKAFIPATELPDPQKGFRRGLWKGVSDEGFSKGFRRGQPRTLQNPFKTPSRTLRKPFKKVSKSMMR